MDITKRTKQEMIDHLRNLAHVYEVDAHRNEDLVSKGKAEAYEIAAFEIERNME